MKKFENLETDSDTEILWREVTTVGNYDVMVENWKWEGLKGNSLIFVSEDVKHLSEAELKNIAKEFINGYDKITLTRGDDFTFMNYNFIID